MSKEQNLQTAEKMAQAINSGNLDQFHQIFSAGVVDHDPAPDQGKGPEGFIKFFTGFREAFPDLQVKPEHTVIDEDNVALAYTATGTHKGNFLGIPATGKTVKIRGMQIAKFKDGKIVERWGSSDELGILKQIGGVEGAASVDQIPAITGKAV